MRKTRYRQMPTQDLLDLHASGILGSTAYDLLESELGERGVTVPPRPNEERPLAEVDEKKHSSSQHKFSILSIKEARNMLDKLSDKNKKKMLLNVFVYYPLAFVVSFSIAIVVLKFVFDEIPPVGFFIVIGIFGIFVAIKHLKQIYKDLLNKNDRKKDV